MPDSEELDEFDRLFKLEPSREDSGVSAELSAMSDFRYDNQSTYDFFPPQESFMTPAQDVLTCPEVFENAEGASFRENQEAAQQSAPLESSSLEASTEEHSRITLKKSIQKKITIRKQKEQTVITIAKKNHTIKCKICGKKFTKAVSLGGHFSKAHPGQSLTYKKKLVKRVERTQERAYLQMAKDWYEQNMDPAPESSKRVRITKIKNMLKAGQQPRVSTFQTRGQKTYTSLRPVPN